MQGLIFDCDGVIIDSESTAHLAAFNQTWKEFGIPWRWSEEQYTEALGISGGKERLDSLYDDPRFRATVDVPNDRAEWKQWVCLWHHRKTQIFIENLSHHALSTRPGVLRLTAQALEKGWRVGVASSGAGSSVSAVVERVMGSFANQLTVVTGDQVTRKKPSGEIYLAAAAAMNIKPQHCIAIEDTMHGLTAATTAGIHCIVTPTTRNHRSSFPGARMVVSCLGEPQGPYNRRLDSPLALNRGWVSIDDLSFLISSG